MRRPLAIVLALALVSMGSVACSTNPATGRRSLTLLSWEQEMQMGADAAPQFTAQFGGAVANTSANRFVNRVGHRLLNGIEDEVPELEWEFTLLDSDVINAFALPGGKVFMSRGLAQRLDSESQLAGVLGHEIGHVTARHGNQRISKQLGFNIALGAAAVAVGVADEDSKLREVGQYAVPALAIGGNVVLLKYGRDEESEADMLGVRYMTRAGYNPMGQVQVMQVLAAAGGGGARQIEWLSTHPYPETRIARLQEMIRDDYAFTQGSPDYQDYPNRYQNQFLSQLGALPRTEGQAILASLGEPSLWCGHCMGGY